MRVVAALVVIALAAPQQPSGTVEAAAPQTKATSVWGDVTSAGPSFTVTTPAKTYTVPATVKVSSYPHAGGSRAVQPGDRAQLTVSGDTVRSAAVQPPWFGVKNTQKVEGPVTAVSAASLTVGGTVLALLPQSLIANKP
ncbi:MAG: hypothetical protein NTZ05_17785, partial [Chloroflexi bacterium]|nr:hypothetical protein [Chloroflexota bacterium]